MYFFNPLMSLTLDERINQFIQPIGDAVGKVIFYSVPVGGADLPLIVLWLVIASLVCTFALGFINFRGFGHAIRIVRGDSPFSTKDSPGQVSHFQALSAAVSGTVGIGNMAGVAVAIAAGGPGATDGTRLAHRVARLRRPEQPALLQRGGRRVRKPHRAVGRRRPRPGACPR